MQESDIILAPGAYDGATAMLVQEAGFPVVYMTGAGVSATYGLPDYGLLTMSEMVDRVGLVSGAVRIPTIADADNGYGNELSTTRTVREYESRGVAALHLEDQVSPKRCGQLKGKEVISKEEYLSKIRAALAARQDKDLVIIARTDALGVLGMDEAVARANAALELGADVAFVEGPRTVEETALIPKLVHGPCLLNQTMGGVTPVKDANEARELGYRIFLTPVLLLGMMVGRSLEVLSEFKTTRQHPSNPGNLSIEDIFRQFGAPEWDELRTRFHEQRKPTPQS